ncbi:hypothetical protein [Candidatus Liberibacter americanus]|uniref:Uncharacterized protein n=1 Tax=Candidatus Liberibacter americanus str. Sao Paulo TaxID=1261131 RepID=U6B525_9HYPH|nr:hypothetical protein [Candidatus Liberibacter americanus]AHA28010.1 hypothetical protein lam_664 [Candidatus Liberibacter americanus str. Sao Paulo]EMS35793.1 hypothetical protein G653_04811 [Candidatus Liberibacter americanus PW_SP]
MASSILKTLDFDTIEEMEEHIIFRIAEDRIRDADRRLWKHVCNGYRKHFLDEAIVIFGDVLPVRFPVIKEALFELHKLRSGKGNLNKAGQKDRRCQIHKIREDLRDFTK